MKQLLNLSSSIVNDLFSVNEVASLFNFVKHVSDVVVPVIQHIICELVLLEINDSNHSVDLGLNPLIDDHVSDFLLSEFLTDPDQLTQSLQSDPAVVLLDDSDVVLDQLAEELLQVSVVVLSLCPERLVSLYLVLDLSVVERHEL